ncbi:MAG: methylated-DNA--[protein]-cysteine S-methyltransferase [Desulfovermiculus sp.]|nr:methylated-DNA--[protein]-cysteine S-methyltransferase [Desulfovermiculus sp.]
MFSLCIPSSSLGSLLLIGTEKGLCGMSFDPIRSEEPEPNEILPAYMDQAKEQLLEYLLGRRTGFEIPLDCEGTPFQLRVWRALRQVPFGHTVSYQDIAREIGNPKACRAVGGANNKNPLPIIIPCHRVIGRDGRLVGYGSGMWRKKWLLQLEGRPVHHGRVHSLSAHVGRKS